MHRISVLHNESRVLEVRCPRLFDNDKKGQRASAWPLHHLLIFIVDYINNLSAVMSVYSLMHV
jgi:hypothetical protein